jgi:hypothetical protein
MMSEHMGTQSSSALLEKWEQTEAAAAAAHELGDNLEPPATLNAAIAAGQPPFLTPKPKPQTPNKCFSRAPLLLE